MIERLNAIKQSVYEGNAERGFWEKGSNENKEERVMLIITELSEAVEAHRIGNWARVEHFVSNITHSRIINEDPTYDGKITPQSAWDAHFKTLVKDSVEDEIADAVIRILDYCGGFDIEILDRICRTESKGNFAADVLQITKAVMKAGEGAIACDWGFVLARIIKLCEWYNINLAQHIDWKLHYNRTRPYKHGKKY